jgi:hypothetical protein
VNHARRDLCGGALSNECPYRDRGLRRSGTENRVKNFHESVSSGLRSGRNSPLVTAFGIENE